MSTENRCAPAPDVAHAYTDVSNTTYGITLSYSCQDGYEEHGGTQEEQTAFCNIGHWEGTLRACQGRWCGLIVEYFIMDCVALLAPVVTLVV